VGTGNYRSTGYELVRLGRIPDIILRYNQPHNMYLFTLATNGLIGLSALLFVFYRIFKLVKTLIKPLQRERLFGFMALSVAVHFMIAGLTEALMNIHILICTFAFIMGVSMRRPYIKGGKV
jgi:O-antigen ligase